MADEDKSEKTENPTAKKLREADEKGNFAQSPEIGAAAVMASALATLHLLGAETVGSVRALTATVFGNLARIDVTEEMAAEWLGSGFAQIVGIVAPFLLVCVSAACFAGVAQTGFKLSTASLEPKFNKLNPVEGFKRIYSINALVQFGIDALKFIAVGTVVGLFVRKAMSNPIFNSPVPFPYVGIYIAESLAEILFKLVLAMIVIATLNYLWQRQKRWKDLMMTKKDVKDENKEQEGNPQVKARRRQLSLSLLQRQMLQDVPSADVIVTNPTHYAVALRYEAGRDRAPVVLAKGKNLFAARIRELGYTNGVPMVENRPVAQALFKLGAIGKPIPTELFEGVAAILATVYRRHRYYFHRLKARRQRARESTAWYG